MTAFKNSFDFKLNRGAFNLLSFSVLVIYCVTNHPEILWLKKNPAAYILFTNLQSGQNSARIVISALAKAPQRPKSGII